ncbi:hypothetical protein TVAG_222540 [Trichomonas vaginalis G3]|uniref:Importin N-terminal domain-containing protein n=1 Tax=Trichomonas vaginalis (strain ATCC PRA-98 / G3) TaxID=412133 RepID=A2F5D0_TRIV3|nr:armadillo (ARM) repeat-containing protein family [Trichomonas vaginalis G3]EAX99893.1 hypothetical protein TVAG_222540 [Trichomonas vaginalis G3]KAI5492927.1 armadillo (ARM) repeat-containing protein family [Trichomonas vaginalis G3]|eukprot:XP_001312823.1 hypothetical protein [Trichomonas vaginalis G3]
MDFNPSAFLVLQSQDQNALDSLMSEIDELHQNPNFIFALIQSLTSDVCKNLFIAKQILIQIKNSIRLKWYENDFWPDEAKKVIIENAFQLLFVLPNEIRNYITYIFEEIAPRYYSYTWWVEYCITLFDQHSELTEVAYLMTIVNFWFKSCSERIDSYESVIDEISIQLFQRIYAYFDTSIENAYNNCNYAILLDIIIKSLRYSLSFSYLIPESGIFDNIIPKVCSLLTMSDSSNEFVTLKVSILKLLNTCHSTLIGKQKKKKAISKDPRRVEFAAHFREALSPIISQTIQTILPNPHNPAVLGRIIYTIYQLIFFSIDTSLINESLFNLIISASQITPDLLKELESNPQLFIAQEMDYNLIKKSIPRNVTFEIINTLLTKHNIEGNVIIQYISPDIENDNPEVIDAKLFLIGALDYCFKQKEFEKYQKDQLKAEKHHKTIGEFEVPNVLPPEVAEICEAVIAHPNSPLYLVLTALHVYAKVVRHVDPEHGCAVALEVMQTEVAQSNPLVVLFSSKLFNTCYKRISGSFEFDITPFVELVINAAMELPARGLFKFFSLLVEKNPQSVVPCISDVVQTLTPFLVETIGNEDQSCVNTTADYIVSTLVDIMDYIQDNTEIMTSLLELIYPTIVELVASANPTFPHEDFILILSFFSLNIKNHDRVFYEGFINVYNAMIAHDDFSQILLKTATPRFVWYLYPLIADQNEFAADQAFSTAATESAMLLYNLFIQHKKDGGFTCDPLPYILYLMAVVTQGYGIVDSFIQVAYAQLEKFVTKFQQKKKPRSNCNMRIIVALVYLLSASSQYNIEVLQGIAQNETILNFFLNVIPHHVLTTYKESKAGIILLLNLLKLGVTPAFQAACYMVNRLLKLKERDNSDDEDEENVDNEENDDDSDSSDDSDDSDSDDSDSDSDDSDDSDSSDSDSDSDDDSDDDSDSDEEEETKDESDDDDYIVSDRIICPYHLPMESINEFEIFKSLVEENSGLIGLISEDEAKVLHDHF